MEEMSKRDYIQTNKDWLLAKSKEEGVKALPKGIYYKVPLGFSASADNTQRMMMSFSRFLMTYDINHNPYYSYLDIYKIIKICH